MGLTPEIVKGARRVLMREELRNGKIELKPYKDSLGYWTIGIGRLIGKRLEDQEITEATALQMFNEDIAEAFEAVERIYGRERIEKMGTPRIAALLSMAFQMGEAGLSLFVNFNRAVKEGRWADAKAHGKDSEWFRAQTKNRANRILEMLESNSFAPYEV